MAMEDRKQGGMTGATGSLTPSEAETNEEFVPAETREMSDPSAARQLTASAHRRAEARHAEGEDDPGHVSHTDDAVPDPSPILGGDERHDPADEHL